MARVMVSLPEDLLVRLDAEAERLGLTRSALLRLAGEPEPGATDEAAVAGAVQRSRDRFARAGLAGDAAAIVRLDRDERDVRDRRRGLGVG